MRTTIVLIMLSVAVFSGCKKSSGTPFTPTCTGAAKSWATDVKPVMLSSCCGCHSSYSSYSSAYSSRDKIRSKIVDGSMPQSGSMSDAQKNIVVCWIDNGAPNN